MIVCLKRDAKQWCILLYILGVKYDNVYKWASERHSIVMKSLSKQTNIKTLVWLVTWAPCRSHSRQLHAHIQHEFHETCHSITFIVLVSGQFTPKMKANAVLCLLYLRCELTRTMIVKEWQISWNSCCMCACNCLLWLLQGA